MDYLWDTPGMPLVYHRNLMGYTWPTNGLHMGEAWTTHELPIGCPRATRGPPLESHELLGPWATYGLLMRCLRGALKVCVSYLSNAQGTCMGYIWHPHGMPMGSPWNTHGMPMVYR